MTKKKIFLLLLVVLLIIGYIKLFYKTYDANVVPASADYMVVLDVKRITNTLLWNIITSPGQWKSGNIFTSKKQKISWKDMIEIPDYIFAFHVKNQPGNLWYVTLPVNDEEDFAEGLQQYGFQKTGENEYISVPNNIHILKYNKQLLIANASLKEPGYFTAVAKELFTNKGYINKDCLAALINAKSHLTVHIPANDFLQKDGLVTANFDKEKISIIGSFLPRQQYPFSEKDFAYHTTDLYTLNFTQPSPALYGLMSDSSKIKISTVINLSLDSLMLRSNSTYSLNISDIKSRVDSAITYGYDDDFNKIEKRVLNKVQEPAFTFSIAGDSLSKVYTHWMNTGIVEQTEAGNLFTAMPFVKAYCSNKSEHQLNITSANYINEASDKTVMAIFFQRICLSKIPADFFKYLPERLNKLLVNIDAIEMTVQKENTGIVLKTVITKKKNDLPLIAL